MRMLYVVHIVAGSLSLVCGYVALFAAKGATVHRRSGTVFVYAMLTMAIFGAMLAAIHANIWSVINVPAGLMTAYLVATSLTTVRPPAWWSPRVGGALMLLAAVIGATMLTLGIAAIAGGGSWNGIPAFPFFLFGVVGALGSIGDLRTLRAGALRGAPRLTRHLWRMTFALFIAAMSFFIGQQGVIPKAIRIPALLATPVVIVLVTMVYWLWRVRIRRSLRGMVVGRVPEPVQ
jgi:uncharacterized membrane protein